uniref:BHLH domain-containing protein n=1 Tax=Syphacia muris TaxID=451379 RepID=A0A0N5A8H1_9BILA
MTSREPIHSGHFMTSNPHNDVPDEDEDVEVEVVDDEEDRIPEGDAETSRSLKQDEKPVTFYKFGPKKTQSIAIDVSLNKINKCIKVAYNKMTTPKWKDFKGLRLHWKQRIRLNNVIWRAYYMEFRRPAKNKFKKTPYCYFAVPDDDTTHVNISGTVMEGMYWKRRMEAVCAQYKRWRHFSRSRCKKGRKRGNSACCDGPIFKKIPPKSQTPKNTSSDSFGPDDLNTDFADPLFESLLQPYMFPNPKEMPGCNADVMQPGLLSLQPSIEEIMSSLNDTPSSARVDTDQVPPPAVSSSYSAKEYDTAHLLVDYGNQTQPTRQPSSISSQMLMANSFTPTYSQAACERVPPMPPYADSSNLDYVPQFLASSTLQSTSSSVLSNRPWWMLTQPHSFLGSPSTPSSLMQSPSGLSPISVNCHTSVSPLIINPPSNETVRSNTPSKGALKAYPSPSPQQKNSSRWVLSSSPVTPNSMLQTNSLNLTNTMPNSAVSMEASGVTIPEGSPWKVRSPVSPNVSPSIPIPQPVYPSLSGSMASSSSASLESSSSLSTSVPLVASAVPPHPAYVPTHSGLLSPHPPTVLVKEEEEEKERTQLTIKRFRSVAADSTIEPVERKRILHLNAEQNRRSALKDGFEQLLNLLPHVYTVGTKPTNALVLARAAERIRELNNSLSANNKKAEECKQYIRRLEDKIASLQASLPSSSRNSTTTVSQKTLVEQFLERYIKDRSRQDYRFWLMAKMMRPFLDSFCIEICKELQNREALINIANDWLRVHFQPTALRPLAPSILMDLASNTSFLTDPSSLQKHVQKEISKQ